MNLHSLLLEREAAGRPVTVGLIGAGKFGTMFLSQARLTRGMHIVAVADLNVARARDQLKTANWPVESYAASSLDDGGRFRSAWGSCCRCGLAVSLRRGFRRRCRI